MYLHFATADEGSSIQTLEPSMVYLPGFYMHDSHLLQELVYFGDLKDQEPDIPAFLLRHFHALPRFNPRVMETEGDEAGLQVALTKHLAPPPPDQINYLHHPGTENVLKAITHWVVADLTTKVPPF